MKKLFAPSCLAPSYGLTSRTTIIAMRCSQSRRSFATRRRHRLGAIVGVAAGRGVVGGDDLGGTQIWFYRIVLRANPVELRFATIALKKSQNHTPSDALFAAATSAARSIRKSASIRSDGDISLRSG
jgi:hypothetical protein